MDRTISVHGLFAYLAPMNQNILSIDRLSKSYGRIQAVKNLSFSVLEGSVFGILGPNGSGKTTTLGMLLDVIRPGGGTFAWFGGIKGPQALQRIGAILEHPNFFSYLSGRDNLKIAADIKRTPQGRVEEVLDLVGLTQRAGSRFKTYSLGMKQRLAIAAAMLNEPEVLVLDEPTNGLDPQGIAQVRGLVKDIAGRGVTILLASHLLDEVEKVCSHVAVLKQGQLLYAGEVGQILGNEGEKTWIEVEVHDREKLREILSGHTAIERVAETEEMVKVFANHTLSAEELNRFMADNGIYVSYLKATRLNLEAQFLQLTNREDTEA